MIRVIRRFFEQEIAVFDREHSPQDEAHAYRLATAALLIEMSRADYQVEATEKRAVLDAVQRALDLNREETEELVRLAELEADQATSLYEFTSLINQHFSAEQKAHVVELLWRVAYADGKLDKYESHLMRKIADLIHVPHATYIGAKLRAEAQARGAGGSREED